MKCFDAVKKALGHFSYTAKRLPQNDLIIATFKAQINALLRHSLSLQDWEQIPGL